MIWGGSRAAPPHISQPFIMKTKPINPEMTRRKFLGATTATVAAFTIIPRHVLGGPKFVPPSEKVNVAIVGAGGQGKTNMRALLGEAEAQIIAVCDPREEADYSRFYYG